MEYVRKYKNIWNIYGIYMEYIWNIYGICMEYIRASLVQECPSASSTPARRTIIHCHAATLREDLLRAAACRPLWTHSFLIGRLRILMPCSVHCWMFSWLVGYLAVLSLHAVLSLSCWSHSIAFPSETIPLAKLRFQEKLISVEAQRKLQ